MSENNFKRKNTILFFVALALTTGLSFIPYFKAGLPGHFVDMLYQMERIEGLKDSILSANFIPRIYDRFFMGYGYGSPLFYSDIFFTLPAVLRIIGFSATQTWKLFVLFIIAANFTVTFFCFKKITYDFNASITGAVSLVLCQFYLLDLYARAGLGEYIATIFLPVLLAGLYDYIVEEGKHTYLIGVALGGMLLSHTIMVFLGTIFTVIVFVIALISPKYRKNIPVGKKVKNLAITALFTIGLTAYYFLPMLEQMASGRFGFNTPWVHVSEYLAPLSSLFELKGTMHFTAVVGLGIGVWMLLGYSLAAYKKNGRNKIALTLIIMGLLVAVMSTSVFPWKIFDNTIMNNLQFSFRILPYAMAPIILGCIMLLASEYNKRVQSTIIILVLLLSAGTAVYQAQGIENSEITLNLDREFLDGEGTLYAGKGEWLPEGMDVSDFEARIVVDESRTGKALYNGGSIPVSSYHGVHTFEQTEEGEITYTLPLIYYKGYSAVIEKENGKYNKLEIFKDSDSLISVRNQTRDPGIITVRYLGTPLQKLSVIITLVSIVLLIVICIRSKKRTTP